MPLPTSLDLKSHDVYENVVRVRKHLNGVGFAYYAETHAASLRAEYGVMRCLVHVGVELGKCTAA